MKILIVMLLFTSLASTARAELTDNTVDGDFTLEWQQATSSPERAEPALTIDEVEIAVRPVPPVKPKDPPRAALFAGDAIRSTTLIHPAKPYQFTLVSRGGKLQLFVNGFADGKPVTLQLSGPVKPVVKDLKITNRALTDADVLARFKAQLPPGHIVVVAHRGVHKHAPENTKISYAQALDAKADIVELDTALTKDGAIILMHDKTVDRTTNGHGAVAELLAADITKLDAGSWKDKKYAGEPVPLLADVAELC
ncbi:MAG: glycerophosphoryl diester phosphodiesterase, partial [Phycisphaerales bacterium]|nr:glycerophosphoryl diester phosphodiesterase [Phycisphaerales bacterium]